LIISIKIWERYINGCDNSNIASIGCYNCSLKYKKDKNNGVIQFLRTSGAGPYKGEKLYDKEYSTGG
jgi:hypothetical protein